MSLGTRLTTASDALFGRLARFRFRYDLFLSYARSDGKPYALKLREQLQALDFSCFLDQDELPPGNSLRSSLSRALRRSATLVVVGTDRACRSTYVAQEIAEFATTGRTIIPIDFQGTLADPPWSVLRERDLIWIDETREALARGVPSPAVADSIDKLFKYTRRKVRVRMQSLATILVFLIGAGVSAWIINGKVQDFIEEQRRANRATSDAEKASAEAKRQAGIAEASKKSAEIARRAANNQARIAREKTEQAKQEQQRAEEMMRESQARLLATEAERSWDGTTGGLVRGVLVATKSLQKKWTLEGWIALAGGLRLLPPRPEAVLSCSCGFVRAAAFHTDGRRLAVGGEEGLAVLEPAEGWRELFSVLKGGPVRALAFSGDGRWLAAGTSGEVHVLDAATGRSLAVAPVPSDGRSSYVTAVSFSPDGRYLAAAAEDHTATLLERGPEEDAWQPVLPAPRIQVGSTYILSLAFSSDSRWLALGDDFGVSIWDLARKEEAVYAESEILGPEVVMGIAFHSKDQGLITAGDQAIRFWRLRESSDGSADLTELPEYSISTDESNKALALSPDGRFFATGNWDRTARLWSASDREERSRMILAPWAEDAPVVAFTPDGRRLIVGSEKSLNVWQVSDSHELVRLAGMGAAAFSPSGHWLAVGGDRKLRILQAAASENWPEVARWDVEGEVSSVSFSPDGRWFAAALGKTTIQVVDTRSWQTVMRTEVESEDELSLAFSPRGRWLVAQAGSAVHRIATGTWRRAPPVEPQEQLINVAFSPDDNWMGTRTRRYSFRGRRQPALTRVYAMETGRRVAWRSHKDVFLREEKEEGRMDLIRQLSSWREMLHEAGKSVRSPDRDLKAVSEDDGVRLLERRSGGRTVERLPHDGLRTFSFSPDGRWLVTVGGGAVKVWPLKAEALIAQACARLPADRRPAEWPEAVHALMAPDPCAAADE